MDPSVGNVGNLETVEDPSVDRPGMMETFVGDVDKADKKKGKSM